MAGQKSIILVEKINKTGENQLIEKNKIENFNIFDLKFNTFQGNMA